MDFLNRPLRHIYGWSAIHPEPKIDTIGNVDKNINILHLKTKIGIEVEVENLFKWPEKELICWQTREDGSLRNNGAEFVSYPISGNKIVFALSELFQWLPDSIDFSERTSIHIHLNIRPFNCEQLLNLIYLYIVFERLLYDFASPERYKNIFCVPIGETRLPSLIQDALQYKSMAVIIDSWDKYSGLNLLPVRTFGTVEFRQMRGHRNINKMLNWINILLQLHHMSKKGNFSMEIQMLNTTSAYEQFVVQIFGDQLAAQLVSSSTKKHLSFGVSNAKQIREAPSEFFKELIAGFSKQSNLGKVLNLDAPHRRTITTTTNDRNVDPAMWDTRTLLDTVEY